MLVHWLLRPLTCEMILMFKVPSWVAVYDTPYIESSCADSTLSHHACLCRHAKGNMWEAWQGVRWRCVFLGPSVCTVLPSVETSLSLSQHKLCHLLAVPPVWIWLLCVKFAKMGIKHPRTGEWHLRAHDIVAAEQSGWLRLLVPKSPDSTSN